MSCPCGSGKSFESCCEPYIDGVKAAPTPEALMRSRYTAYAKGNLAYIEKTISGPAKAQFDRKRAEALVHDTHWLKLEVLAHREREDNGMVEFRATFEFQGKTQVMHEISTFQKINGKWFYMSGDVSFRRS